MIDITYYDHYWEAILRIKEIELIVYKINNTKYEDYIYILSDDKTDFTSNVCKQLIINKIEEIKKFINNWFDHFKNFPDAIVIDYKINKYITHIKCVEHYCDELHEFIKPYYKKINGLKKQSKNILDINNEVFKILYECEKIEKVYKREYNTNYRSRIYIDKKYYLQHKNEKGKFMILNIPIMYYKRIVKTFDEYYMYNFKLDKSNNNEMFYKYCLYYILQSTDHDNTLGTDNDKNELKTLLNEL